MNDPHVSALVYRIKHGDNVSYDKTLPLEHDTLQFRILVRDKEVRFVLNQHFATVEMAREVVEPLIRQWEFAASIERGPNEFELLLVDAMIEDRNPTPGVFSVKATSMALVGSSVSVVVGRGTYSQIPSAIALNADVEAMALRYARYRQGNETLASMAYFCLTVLEEAAGGRAKIPAMFGVASSVLAVLGRLTGEKGGAEARKGGGRSQEFTSHERTWLDQVIKRLIWCATEVGYDPAANNTQITLADFPTL